MVERRRAIHAYVSERGQQAWHQLTDEEGISLSALFEALALDFADHPPAEGGHPRWDDIVRAARRVDVERRRRR